MNTELQNQLSGAINPETILKVLPVKEKPKRNSYKKATKIVRNSVKGRTKKITQEQGFRNYLQYTDPLLLNNNELDQSDLAESFAKILNVFAPKKLETEKMKEVQKFLVSEKPVDVNEIKTQRPDRNVLADAAVKRTKAYMLEKQNKAISKLQAIKKGNDVRKQISSIPYKDELTTLKTFGGAVIQQVPTTPVKRLRKEVKVEIQSQQENKAAATIQSFMKRKRGRPAGVKNRTPEEKEQDRLNKELSKSVHPQTRSRKDTTRKIT